VRQTCGIDCEASANGVKGGSSDAAAAARGEREVSYGSVRARYGPGGFAVTGEDYAGGHDVEEVVEEASEGFKKEN